MGEEIRDDETCQRSIQIPIGFVTPWRHGKMRPKSRRLIEPGEDAVEDDGLEVELLDPDRLEVGLVVEPAGGVVVATAVARRDVERHVQAASDLVEDLMRELGAG